MAAAAGGDVEMLKLILSRPLSVNRAEARTWTALSFASQYGHTKCVAALLDRGADRALADKVPRRVAMRDALSYTRSFSRSVAKRR